MKCEMNNTEMRIYETPDGTVKIDVRLEDDTVWLTQADRVQLFQSSRQNIGHHIRGIYEEGELHPEATVKKYLTVRQKRSVKCEGRRVK